MIDSDFRGPIGLSLYNDSSEVVTIDKGERVAQLVVIPFYTVVAFHEVEELDKTVRGAGGFGSTGRK